MMNFKQQEVLQAIVAKCQEKFPDLRLLDVQEPGSNNFWGSVTELPDENEQFELDDVMAELSTDALVDYGFPFQFVPQTRYHAAAQ